MGLRAVLTTSLTCVLASQARATGIRACSLPAGQALADNEWWLEQ